MKTEHIKVFTGSSILVNELKNRLLNNGITSIVKNRFESAILGGFGEQSNSVELHILNTDKEKATPIIETYTQEINL